MRLLALIVVTAGLACAVAASPAGAAPELKTVGHGTSPVAVDGGALAYMRSASRVRVIDGGLHERASVATPAGCTWQTMGGGALLWNCQTMANGSVLSGLTRDLVSGQMTMLGPPPTRPPGPSGPESESWLGIGAQWLAARYGGYHYSAVEYLARDGRRSDESLDRSVVADLDSPELWQHMCAPLKRRMAPDENFPVDLALGPYTYRPPYGAARSFHNASKPARLVLDRCGQDRPRVLSRCPHTCSDPVIGDHAVAWIEGGDTGFELHPIAARLRVFLIDRKRTLTWRLGRKPATAAILGRRAFVAQSGRLKTVKLPRDRL